MDGMFRLAAFIPAARAAGTTAAAPVRAAATSRAARRLDGKRG
jgi:hypothetical protein